MKETNDKKKNLIVDAVIGAVLVCIVLLVIIALTYKRETHINESFDEANASGLTCVSNNNDGDIFFFSSDDATRVEHKIKLLYKDGIINKLSYEFLSEYDSEEIAKEAKGAFNTKYNIYMGENGVKQEVLSPVFQYVGNKAKVELYLDDYKKMNSVIGKMFYINGASLDSVSRNSEKETKKYYENKGFSCIIND